MKKLFYLIAGICLSLPAHAQLQNLDFESWDHPLNHNGISLNNPTGWTCTNRWYGTSDAQFSEVFRDPVDTFAASKKCALRLFTWYNYMKDAAVQTAAFQQRPKALRGLYKYEENFIFNGSKYIIDTAQVSVLLSRWNHTLSQRDTIGFGLFNAGDSVKEFTAFKAEIVYRSSALPDSITIYLDPSIIGRDLNSDVQNLHPGGNSVFTLDGLTLSDVTPTGITSIKTQLDLQLYPNPAQGQIHFQNLSGDAVINDVSGRTVLQFKISNSNSVDISSLSKGVYVLQITNREGVHTGRFEKW